MAAVRDRAQLILVGGLALAVVLVAIALVLNSAIYTENLASRTDVRSSHDAAAFTTDLRGGVVGTMGDADTESPDESEVAARVNSMGDDVARYAGRRGVVADVADVDHEDVEMGARFTQLNGQFTDDAGNEDYNIGRDTAVRNFTMTLNRDSLVAGDSLGNTLADYTGNEAFIVRFGSANERVIAFTKEGSNEVTVTAFDEDGDYIDSCTRPTSDGTSTGSLSVDVTDGQFGRVPCAALTVLDGPSTYDVDIENGDNAAGEYHFVVLNDGSASVATNLDSKRFRAVYAVTVDVTYQTPDLHYETTLRIAPGEPDA